MAQIHLMLLRVIAVEVVLAKTLISKINITSLRAKLEH